MSLPSPPRYHISGGHCIQQLPCIEIYRIMSKRNTHMDSNKELYQSRLSHLNQVALPYAGLTTVCLSRQ